MRVQGRFRSIVVCALGGTLALISCGKSGSDDDDAGHGNGAMTGAAAMSGGAGGPTGPSAGNATTGGAPSAGGTVGDGAGGGTAGSGTANQGGSSGATPDAGGNGATKGGSAGSPEAGAGAGDGGSGAEGGAGPEPLTLYFMIDRAWLMNDCGDDGVATIENGSADLTIECPTQSRWQLASSVLTDIFRSPTLSNINVALRFFPDDRPHTGCSGYPPNPDTMDGGFPLDAGFLPYDGPNCMADACAEPFVPAAPLIADSAPQDVQEGALLAALDTSAPPGPHIPNPNPQAPTSAAVQGAEQWATEYQAAHPKERVAVVVVTSGLPMGCDTNYANIAAFAGVAEAAGVRTYTLGFDANGQSTVIVNSLAAAGGTHSAYFATDPDVAARFVTAVTEFQQTGQ